MSEKLQLLLDKINFNKEHYSLFNGGKLVKLFIDEKNNVWNFVIHLNNVLPTNVINEFETALKTSFNTLKDIYATFEYESNDNSMVEDYFKHIIEKLDLSKMFASQKIKVEDNVLNISVLNKFEFNKLDKAKKNIDMYFKRYGFALEITIVIDDEERHIIKEAIKKETFIKVEPTKVENPIIYGNEIKSKRVISVRDIIEEEPSIVIEAYVFNVELKEIPNKDFKIAMFKLSDNTDSINAKIFTVSLYFIIVIFNNNFSHLCS